MLHTSAKLQRREARRMVENCPEHLHLHEAIGVGFHEAIGVGFMVMPAERWGMYLRFTTAPFPETSSGRSTHSPGFSAFASARQNQR